MKKIILSVVAIIGLVGCSDDPLTIMQTDGVPVAIYNNSANACIGSSSTLDRIYVVSIYDHSIYNDDDNTWIPYTDYQVKARCVNGATFALKYSEKQNALNRIDATVPIIEESY